MKLVEHWNSVKIEEQILDTLAWQSDSPLWAALDTLQVPSCEEVTVPQNIEPAVRSPIIHPRVERISGEVALKRGLSPSYFR
jgi:retinoblastoma-like protein 1